MGKQLPVFVYGDNNWYSEFVPVANVLAQVAQTLLQQLEILLKIKKQHKVRKFITDAYFYKVKFHSRLLFFTRVFNI